MLDKIIQYSINHKLIVILFSLVIVAFGLFSLAHLPIGAVPDVTNNQVQIISTSRNLATEDVEKFLTYPVELEMANLPGVKEIRSISKFGLSVVTVVFDDDQGTYLPRQLIAEKIKLAEEKIPQGFSTPFMGPISTGLGEIYQYIIDVDPKYKDQYNLSDIRTIQDWVIKRQLSGIPGVVEVNTWGGYLKQYEVSINPNRLKSLNISISDAFQALERNNGVAGGGYIEKNNQAYFIRAEGLIGSIEDIENIVITERDGRPVFIRDIGKVIFGKATRFGAITGNGEGEKVLGQVMMLKGANSNDVIEAVKQRVKEIQPSLPKGIKINAFLERSELIGKTTFTIAENLILGCLIVIFVVVLLLGNIRSGIVVASVIPMSLLFTLSMMYIFEVDANLMSLGAIDFGIIIDGAVIIVEYIAFKINSERAKLLSLSKTEKQGFIDSITGISAKKMMHSAVFGQLIIIIVFIPILSLVGVEGKMFKPMAIVFCFALIGAMLLCFTYIPVMSSLFIKPDHPEKKGISKKLINFLDRNYRPTMAWSLRNKSIVISASAILLVSSIFVFSRMGAEFIPTLDEGDFVIQPVLKTGTSLSNTIETTTQIEKILLKFPEVSQVVSRIGAAEVPTDPMSMEESDVIIKLNPKSEWVTATSKDELADKLKEALEIIPGIEYEFTQPIEMRFNELITGVRADLAIKIFGEDLDILYNKAVEIQNLINGVEGAADITVEKIAGLPQMTVKYDRMKIAKYGLNIEELNQIISIGFAGQPAGTVFEGEKQFDLVLRYDKNHQSGIRDLENSVVNLPNGQQMPLSEFAEITPTKGPAKISRDNTRRRIVIGVNVRNRDLQSVVNDIQKLIDEHISLPPNYTINYGGQFENLLTAKRRLQIAVPVALALIFIMLYFAFNSVKEALLIYSAIPLSAVGGIWLLYIRDLPFSISAGVGFIALFGIAVLNGIVLIEEFKELKAHGVTNLNKRILIGTKNRLRPILLTATAATFGFLPMALSSSAGAEVQRPLATVVVGGLITATALTLVVLPVLYAIFDRKKLPISKKPVALLMIAMALPFSQLFSQETPKEITLIKAIEIAMKNNAGIRATSLEIKLNDQLKGSAFNIDKTELFFNYDQNNIAPNDTPLKVFGINQSFMFPTVYSAQKNVINAQSQVLQNNEDLKKVRITKSTALAYYEIIYWQNKVEKIRELDSIYSSYAKNADLRFQSGESNYLEKLSAEGKKQTIINMLTDSEQNLKKAISDFNQNLQSPTKYTAEFEKLEKLALTLPDTTSSPTIQYFNSSLNKAEALTLLQKKYRLPDFNLSIFQGTNNAANAQNYTGVEIGIAIPLFPVAYNSKIKAAKTYESVILAQKYNYRQKLLGKYSGLLADLARLDQKIEYFKNTGLKLSNELILHANQALESGEINFTQFVQLTDQGITIYMNYLDTLIEYNKIVLEINYLIE